MRATLPDFDELRNIRTSIADEISAEASLETDQPKPKINRKRLEDMIFDLLTMSYVYGLEVAGLDLKEDIPTNREQMMRLVFKPTAGETAFQRFNNHIRAYEKTDLTPANLTEDLARLAETEAHRVLNEAILESAQDYKKRNPGAFVTKTWETMGDDRVREPHEFLEGSTVPVDAYFYTDGDKALEPGGFSRADLNVNCRCIIRINPNDNA